MKINLRFVEKMYSFPDNLRNPSCDQENGKSEEEHQSWAKKKNLKSSLRISIIIDLIIIIDFLYEHIYEYA